MRVCSSVKRGRTPGIERVKVGQVPEGQRPRLARALAQAIGSLDGLEVVDLGRVSRVHKGQQGAQLGEHHRPGCMDTASFVAEPESLQLFVVFVLFGHVVINPGIPLASS